MAASHTLPCFLLLLSYFFLVFSATKHQELVATSTKLPRKKNACKSRKNSCPQRVISQIYRNFSSECAKATGSRLVLLPIAFCPFLLF